METGDGGRHGPRQLEIGDGDGGASPILANPGRGRGRLRGASPGPSPDTTVGDGDRHGDGPRLSVLWVFESTEVPWTTDATQTDSGLG